MYDWNAVQSVHKPDHQQTSLQVQGIGNVSGSQKLSLDLWENLSIIDDATLASTYSAASSVLKEKKKDSLSGKSFSPIIGVKEGQRVLVIPSTLKSDPNLVGVAMLRYAQFLKMEIREFEYSLDQDPGLNSDTRDMGLTLFTSLEDYNKSINVTSTAKNLTESVRKFVRAQQVLGFISHRKQKPDCLKRNQRLWGNNPGEKYSIEVRRGASQQFNVEYFKTEMHGLWREKAFATKLTDLFVSMIRETWACVDSDIMLSNVTDCILPYTEMVNIYCANTEKKLVKQGKKTVTVEKRSIPSKPRDSPLLLSAESKVLNTLCDGLFGKTYYEEHISEWALLVLGTGFSNIKTEMQDLMAVRGAYVRSFAQLTTNRLSELRGLPGTAKDIKKKDVKFEDLTKLLLSRQNPIGKFADEIMHMDPQVSGFLSVYLSGGKVLPKSLPGVEALTESLQVTLEELIFTMNPYDDLTRVAEQLAAYQQSKNNLIENARERADLMKNFRALIRSQTKPKHSFNKVAFTKNDLVIIANHFNASKVTLKGGASGLGGKGKKRAGYTTGPTFAEQATPGQSKSDQVTYGEKVIDFGDEIQLTYDIIASNAQHRVELWKREKNNPVVKIQSFSEYVDELKERDQIYELIYRVAAIPILGHGVEISWLSEAKYGFHNHTFRETVDEIVKKYNLHKGAKHPSVVVL
jgi:hypothetical protein